MVRVAINGFGRIGRQSFKAMLEYYPEEFEIVAINDLTDAQTLAHLLRYDSTYGAFDGEVTVTEKAIVVELDDVRYELLTLAERDPAALPWKELGVDIVIESTGLPMPRRPKHIWPLVLRRSLSPHRQKARILPSVWVSTTRSTTTRSTTLSQTHPAPPTVWHRSRRCSMIALESNGV